MVRGCTSVLAERTTAPTVQGHTASVHGALMETDAAFWDKIADDYAKRPWPCPEATARKLALTRAMLAPEHRLLDLGCGTGTILIDLAPAVSEAVGVDVSPVMIRIAEGKAAAAGSKATFRVEPAAMLDGVPDASFHCVCAFNLLHLVPDPPALLRAIERVLVPGGVLVASTPCLGGVWFPPYAILLPIMRWVGKAPAVTLIAPAELRAMVEAAGFVQTQAPDVGQAAPDVFLVARKR